MSDDIYGHSLVCSVACVANIANTVVDTAYIENMERMNLYIKVCGAKRECKLVEELKEMI